MAYGLRSSPTSYSKDLLCHIISKRVKLYICTKFIDFSWNISWIPFFFCHTGFGNQGKALRFISKNVLSISTWKQELFSELVPMSLKWIDEHVLVPRVPQYAWFLIQPEVKFHVFGRLKCCGEKAITDFFVDVHISNQRRFNRASKIIFSIIIHLYKQLLKFVYARKHNQRFRLKSYRGIIWILTSLINVLQNSWCLICKEQQSTMFFNLWSFYWLLMASRAMWLVTFNFDPRPSFSLGECENFKSLTTVIAFAKSSKSKVFIYSNLDIESINESILLSLTEIRKEAYFLTAVCVLYFSIVLSRDIKSLNWYRTILVIESSEIK